MSNFIDQMAAKSQGVLRGNRFKVKIFFPPVLGLIEETNMMEFYVMSDSIPSKTIGMLEVPVAGGAKLKVPGDAVVPDWAFNYMHDTKMKIRKAFARWGEYMYSNVTGMARNDASVFGSAEVSQMSTTNEVVNIWEMVKIFPTDAGSVEQDKASNDEFMTSDVSMAVNDIIEIL